jgi:flagellar motility protein MotE (MotC chaperone)
MMKFIRDLRLIPIAVIACACLLVLKAADLFLSSGTNDNLPQIEATVRSTPDVPRPGSGQSQSMLSWASQMFNFPDGSGATAPPSPRGDRLSPRGAALPPLDRNLDITGSVPEPAEKTAANQPANKTAPAVKEPPKQQPAGTVIPLDNSAQISGAERAILERLQQRRQELDTRARELDIRESLIKAAEKRIEGQLAELKETESRIKVETQQKDDAQAARFKGLVTMYENMKPRDAAKIFDRLDAGVLLEVASKIEPRHMADILAQMSPDSAQHLTVQLADQAQQVKPASGGGPGDLPKIQGQPTQ